MTARRLKIIAIAGLALAIALVAFALQSGLKAGSTTGPETLAVTPQGEVSLGVGQQIWRTSREGHLLQQMPLADMPLPGRPSNLLRHPDGHMVATVRDDPRLHIIDPASGQVVRTITPHWPADLQKKGQEAINVAFAPDGRFAIATGGGHTVALFDADGGFIARTKPGTYAFTNGLWWTGEDLWTTDTNRIALRRLDGRTLAELQAVQLDETDAARYLGPARAASAAGDPPVAMIRLRNGMIRGRVVILHPGHDEVPLPHDDAFEPNDVEWLGEEVLATDGAGLAVRRWTVDGHALSEFGDTSLTTPLHRITATRARLQRWHDQGLMAGIGVFAIAAVLALVAQRREQHEARAAVPVGERLDLSHLGTPRPSRGALAALLWRTLWPFPLLAALALWVQAGGLRRVLDLAFPRSDDARLAVSGAVVLVAAVLAIWLVRLVNRKSRMVAFEPVYNAVALRQLLRASTAMLPMAEGEHVIETFMLARQDTGPDGHPPRRARDGLRWVVCTNQGLRLFGIAGTTPWLDVEVALDDVAAVATQPGADAPKPWTRAGMLQRAARRSWLQITLRDGRTIAGSVTSITVRDRFARLLSSLQADAVTPAPARSRVPPTRAAREAAPSPVHAALASLLVPGLGQWWQRRTIVGLLLFLFWVVYLLARTIPITWTALGVHAEVSPRRLAITLATQAVLAAIAGWDAWRAGQRDDFLA